MTQASTGNYWISNTALSITLNALGEPDRIQGSAAGGAVIMCYIRGIDGLGYDNGHNYKRWNLSCSPTVFGDTKIKYVCVAIPRPTADSNVSQDNAFVCFPSEDIDLYGQNAGGTQVGSTNYYYINLGGIIASSIDETTGDKIDRVWSQTVNYGTLATDEAIAGGGADSWWQYSSVDNTIQFLKTIADATFNVLRLSGGYLNKVATYLGLTDDDEHAVVTTHYLQQREGDIEEKYLRKDQDDTDDYKLTLNKLDTNGEVNLKDIVNAFAMLQSNGFVDSMTTGKGWGVDASGNMQVESLEVRSALRVLELVYNRLSAEESEYVFTESGTIENVGLTFYPNKLVFDSMEYQTINIKSSDGLLDISMLDVPGTEVWVDGVSIPVEGPSTAVYLPNFKCYANYTVTTEGELTIKIWQDESHKFQYTDFTGTIEIEKIVYYYSDGTARTYLSGQGGYLCTLKKRSDTDFHAFRKGDILRGIVNNLTNMGAGEYYTIWMQVVDINTAETTAGDATTHANTITVSLYADADVPSGTNYDIYPLAAPMVVQRWGNAVEPSEEAHNNEDYASFIEKNSAGEWINRRQSCWYISSIEKRICMLDGVDKPKLSNSNYAAFFGLPTNFEKNSAGDWTFMDYTLNPLQPYLYCRGAFLQDIHYIDYNGVVMKMENPRGNWSAATAKGSTPYMNTDTYYDTVYHNNAKWQCASSKTTDEPSSTTAAWVLLEEAIDGESALSCRLTNEMDSIPLNSKGITTKAETVSTTLEMYYGGEKQELTAIEAISSDSDVEVNVEYEDEDGTFFPSSVVFEDETYKDIRLHIHGISDEDLDLDDDSFKVYLEGVEFDTSSEDSDEAKYVKNGYFTMYSGHGGNEFSIESFSDNSGPDLPYAKYTGVLQITKIEFNGNTYYPATPTGKVTCTFPSDTSFSNGAYITIYGECAKSTDYSTAIFSVKGIKETITITNREVKYATSSGGSESDKPSESSWQTTIPTTTNGNYLWTRTKVTYSDGNVTTAYSVSRMGVDGKGVQSSVVDYYVNAANIDPTTIASTSWGSFPSAEEQVEGYWLYTRSRVTYSDGSVTISYSVAQIGTGSSYAGVSEYYALGASSTEVPGGSSTYPSAGTHDKSEDTEALIKTPWSTTHPTEDDTKPENNGGTYKPYLWNFEISRDSGGTKYVTAPMCIGNYSKGIVSVVETYAISAESVLSDTVKALTWTDEQADAAPTEEKKYQWNKTVTTYTNGTNDTTYHISAVKGADGYDGKSAYEIYVAKGGTLTEEKWLESLVGASGKSVKTITEYYAINNDKDNYPSIGGSDWSTTINQPTSAKPYLWNYEVSKDDDGNVIATTTPVIIGKYSADGRGVSSVEEQYYASDSSTAPSSSTSGSPSSSAAGFAQSLPYLYNRERVKYTDNTYGSWTAWQQISFYGQDGIDGDSALVANLTNEMSSVALTSAGLITTVQTLTTTFEIYLGTSKQTLTSLTATSSSALITAVADADTGIVTCTAAVSTTAFPDVVDVTIEGTCAKGTLSAVFSIGGIKAGAKGSTGTSPTIYELQTSLTAIKVDKDGNYVDAATQLTCTVSSHKGTTTTNNVSYGSIKMSIDGGDEIAYKAITLGTTYSPTKSIKYILYSSSTSSVVVDRQTLPVVADGANAITAALSSYSDCLNLNSSGYVDNETYKSTVFSLYSGTEKQTLTSLRAESSDGDVEVNLNVNTGLVSLTFPEETGFSGGVQVTIYGKCAASTQEYSAVFSVRAIVAAKDGDDGAQGYSIVASIERGTFTEANWTTYGTIGHAETWSGTESSRNGCRVGDIFTIVGTATDTGNSHVLYYRSDTASGNLHGSCISHAISKAGKDGEDGVDGADGVQSNIFGYDNALVANGSAVHTATGCAAFLTIQSSGYAYLHFKKDSAGSTWASGTKLSISCSVKLTNVSGVSSATVLLTAEGTKVAGTNSAKISSGGSAFLYLKTTLTSAMNPYIRVAGTSGATCIVEITNLKIEVATDLVGVYTPYAGLADDSIAEQEPNLIVDTYLGNKSKWVNYTGGQVPNLLQGICGYSRSETMMEDDDAQTLRQDMSGKLEANTWYALSYWTKLSGSGCSIYSKFSASISDGVLQISDGVALQGSTNVLHSIYTGDSYDSWTQHTIIFRTVSSMPSAYHIIFGFKNESGDDEDVTFYLCMPKLEKCERVTLWCPNEADNQGASIRVSSWTKGQKYYAGNSGEPYQDIVICSDYSHEAFLCKYTHTASDTNKPSDSTTQRTSGWDADHPWVASDVQEFVATKVLLAQRAKIENLYVDVLDTEYNGLRTEISGGTFNVYGSNNNVAITIQLDDAGMPHLIFNDSEGNELYDLGPDGISDIKSHESYYTSIDDLSFVAKAGLYVQNLTNIVSMSKTTLYKFVEGYTYSSGVKIYYINSSSTPSVYNGRVYHTNTYDDSSSSKRKPNTTGITTSDSTGYYVKSSTIGMQSSRYIYETVIYSYSAGDLTDSIVIRWTTDANGNVKIYNSSNEYATTDSDGNTITTNTSLFKCAWGKVS